MTALAAALTDTTCGEACWQAREDVCRCSCGGANHGCLRTADGVQPARTAKVDGVMRRLLAVGLDLEADARRLNQAAGCFYSPIAARSRDIASPAKLRTATAAQVERWPELAAYRGRTTRRPDLLWLAMVPVTVSTDSGGRTQRTVQPMSGEEQRACDTARPTEGGLAQ